jgi:hypothetical protein
VIAASTSLRADHSHDPAHGEGALVVHRDAPPLSGGIPAFVCDEEVGAAHHWRARDHLHVRVLCLEVDPPPTACLPGGQRRVAVPSASAPKENSAPRNTFEFCK